MPTFSWTVESNPSVDKKASAVNQHYVRGSHVMAEAWVSSLSGENRQRAMSELIGVLADSDPQGAARKLAQTIAGNIATVLPDRAERYFSTALL